MRGYYVLNVRVLVEPWYIDFLIGRPRASGNKHSFRSGGEVIETRNPAWALTYLCHTVKPSVSGYSYIVYADAAEHLL